MDAENSGELEKLIPRLKELTPEQLQIVRSILSRLLDAFALKQGEQDISEPPSSA